MGIPGALFISNDRQRVADLKTALAGRVEVVWTINEARAKKTISNFPDISLVVFFDVDACEKHNLIQTHNWAQLTKSNGGRILLAATDNRALRAKYEQAYCCACACPWDELADVIIIFTEKN